MDELAGGLRGAHSPPPSPQLLPDDMLVDILLRLPPEPIHLFRASFVSKHWRGLVHDARFLRRFREFHRGTPPILGFFNNQPGPLFVTTSDGFTVPAAATMRHDEWWALDCRHGRALLLDQRHGRLLVWDLMNGEKRYLGFPPTYQGNPRWHCRVDGAVLCAAGHGDCHSCPFLVAFVFSQSDFTTSACVYSSETGVWGEIYSIEIPDASVTWAPTPLIGNTLYWMLDTSGTVDAIENEYWIIEFDLDTHNLDLTGEIPYDVLDNYNRQIVLMPADDGQLGFAGVHRFSLHLWSSVACVDGMVTWAHCRVIDLENFLALEAVAACRYLPDAVGYAEDVNVIFIHVHPIIYMIHLNTMQIEEVSEKGTYWFVFPYTSFYTPGITTGGGDDQVEALSGS